MTIIGAGNVGASCAQRLAEKNLGEIVLVDIIEGLPQGKALDILQSAPLFGFDTRLTGTNDYKDTANSDVVVITSGTARKPGMSRDDLLLTNMKIVSDVVGNVTSQSQDAVVIMVTNPVDAMTYLALHLSRFPRNRVLGLSGALDGARLGCFIAQELRVSVSDVSTCVIGEHGKSMVVVPRLCTVSGTPITQLLAPDAIAKLVERTVNGGAEIVGLLKTGSAFYAPSAAVTCMVEAILRDRRKVFPCAAYLQGEYGLKDTVLGVPVKLGRNGIEEIVELNLTREERQALTASAEAVKELIKVMKLS
ncbi:MAG: malate dehydrogenase [Chloroflexota bacterium]